MIKYALLIGAAVAVAMPGVAAAQAKKGANGGAVVTSQGHPIEFVRKGTDVVFYFSDDDGSPLQTKNVKAKATVQDGGKTTTVSLSPSAPNMMVGKTDAELTPQAKIVLSATMQLGNHAHTLTARFTGQ